MKGREKEIEERRRKRRTGRRKRKHDIAFTRIFVWGRFKGSYPSLFFLSSLASLSPKLFISHSLSGNIRSLDVGDLIGFFYYVGFVRFDSFYFAFIFLLDLNGSFMLLCFVIYLQDLVCFPN